MIKNSLPWSGLVLMSALGLFLVTAFPRTKAKPFSDRPVTAANGPATAAGLRVHVDPVTGRIVPPPARAVPDPAARALFGSSHAGLVEEPGTTAAGGFKVDSRGAFRSAVILRVGTDGKPATVCIDATRAEPRPGE